MAKFTATDPNTGKSVTLEGDSAPSENELNDIFSSLGNSSEAPTQMGGSPSLGFVAKQVLGMTPMAKAVDYATSPSALPVAGAVAGSLAGPGGAAVGAGLGQIGKRMIEVGQGSPVGTPLQEAISPMAQAALGGIGDVSGIASAGKRTVTQAIGKGLAKAAQVMSGAKADILEQAAKQGYKTYAAPSLEKASEIFGQAIGPEGKAALTTTAEQDFDPALSQARTFAKDVGTRIENGESVPAMDALKARQATDRVISATPVTDKKTLSSLYNWRSIFDKVMSTQSGALKDASDLYRQAIVKDTILNPARLMKSGQPSAFLPLVLGAGGRSAEGIVNTLIGTSPAAWGLAATTAGSIPGEASRAALASFIDKVTSKQGGQYGQTNQ